MNRYYIQGSVNRQHLSPYTPVSYTSIMQSFRVVLREEGFRGLYQGMTPALLAAAGSWGGYFYFYESSKTRKLAGKASKDEKLQTFDHLTSGVEAGVILVMLFNPLWVMKTRLALQGAELRDGAAGANKRYDGLLGIDCKSC